MPDIFIGRQPIFDRKLRVHAYELLFRSGNANNAAFGKVSADGATSTTIVNAFMEFGLDKLVGNKMAFINLTESFLFTENALPIPPQQVVVEVLEDIPINFQLIKAVERLKTEGFTIALDDYIYNPAHKPLVALADIIKIDIMQISREDLIRHATQLKKFNAKLLAEKIETMDEFELCHKLGFEYFQGYFLSKPRVIQGKSLPTNKLAVLNLLAVLQKEESDIEELEEAIGFDVSITYRILKLMNSAFFNYSKKIESIRQAVIILGRQKLSSWASMLALSSMSDRPGEMIHMAMTRAKMCELLADKAGIKPLEPFFTTGLFSSLDIMMERELSEIIAPLPLSADIVAALLQHEGVKGEALTCVLAYEISDFESAKFLNLTADDIYVTHIEAITWANMVTESL
ncbi:MAG: HDOD domain-containing protein [Gammaproteobacteria bacterium]|nr:HDOD domain-containing protein [Gammaproteobacteria bacterium]